MKSYDPKNKITNAPKTEDVTNTSSNDLSEQLKGSDADYDPLMKEGSDFNKSTEALEGGDTDVEINPKDEPEK